MKKILSLRPLTPTESRLRSVSKILRLRPAS
jgi:hypothetical protein